jgi:23S rRNA-/tRNA-specific pseudouridylate synthase
MRWIVRPGDGLTVGEVLLRACADADAVRDGRVFVGRRRVRRADERLLLDDVVEIAARRETPPAPRILAQADDVVAVDKPAGMPTIGDHAGSVHALVAMTAGALGVDPARLHPTSRLDREVSGVVLFALTKEAAFRLSRARALGLYERRYVAIAAGVPRPSKGSWDGRIGRAADPRRRTVDGRDAVAATTRYAVCSETSGGASLLAVAPMTGRTHQIRVHAAACGAPLIGDRVYGGPARMTLPGGRVIELRRVALHSARVVVPDARGAAFSITSPLPEDLGRLWEALGGVPAAWEACASCVMD